MTIPPGASLGPYVVKSLLGAGGMGEVYVALDTRLDRLVALKVLPGTFTSDADRVRRFELEARAAAALNHPGIVAVHDVGKHDGTLYLVSELLEGETLRDRLSGRPLPAQVAIDFGIQIADALAAAHERGIVHRDLKPENLFVTRADRIKVLDFGLAKLRSVEMPTVSQDGSTQLAADVMGTSAGQVLGTVGYMSPEQVRGEAADHRADIFAMGAVLYEMLSGRRAFARDSAVETMAAILNEDAPELSLPAAGPNSALDRIVRRCLAKAPDLRFGSAADLAFALQSVASGTSMALPPLPTTGDRRRHAFVAAALLAAGALAGWIAARATAPNDTTAATTSSSARFTVDVGDAGHLGFADIAPLADARTSIAISPDGQTLAFVLQRGDQSEIGVRRLDGFDIVRLPGTAGAFNPFFAPDGTSVAFFTDTALKRVSLRGGDAVTICEARNAFGGLWLPDDTVVFGDREGALVVRVPAAGGSPTTVVAATSPAFIPSSAMPDGRTILMWLLPFGSPDVSPIEVLDLDTGERRVVFEGGTHPVYLPTGHLVFLRGGSLHAVPFDAARLVVTGTPVPVLDGVRTEQAGPGQLAFSRDGTLAYVPGGPAWIGTPVWVDRAGTATPTRMPAGSYGQVRVSPDGRHVAIAVRGSGGDIWVYETDRGTFTRLTQDGRNDLPLWTPDSTSLTFLSERDGERAVVTRAADGSGQERIETTGSHAVPWSWMPDGSALAVQCGDTSNDLCIFPVRGDRALRPIARTQYVEWGAAFSPDGRWVAFTTDASGRYEVTVRPADGSTGQWQVSTGGGEEPVWSRDGRELFYRNGFTWMSVPVETGQVFAARQPRELFRGPYQNLTGFSYDVSSDGQRFLMVASPESQPVTGIRVVTRWFEQLQRLTR